MAMNCPFCNSDKTKITNSRSTAKYTQKWRRRNCLSCQSTFTKYERIDLSFLKVQKNSGKIEIYKREKLFAGIYTALVQAKNSDKGDSAMNAEASVSRIELLILKQTRRSISTQELTNIVSQDLIEHHPDGFLRYIAYIVSSGSKRSISKQMQLVLEQL